MNYFFDVNLDYSETDLKMGVKRHDADTHSMSLYDHLWKVFFFDRDKNLKYGIREVKLVAQQSQRTGLAYYTLFVNGDEHLLSSDYIGPSTYWCVDDKTSVLDIVKESRVLGGHILWPRGFQNTINQVRGGSNGLYDRMDATLSLLKLYYDLIHDQKSYTVKDFLKICQRNLYHDENHIKQDKKRLIGLFTAFENSKSWLMLFKTFPNFCDFFYLVDSFVDCNYNVIKFDEFLFPITRPGAIFRENNIKAIQKRNIFLVEILGQHSV